MEHYIIRGLDVPAYLGERTVIDTTVNPEVVHELHLDFQGYAGDELMTVCPVYVVTLNLATLLLQGGCTGFILADFSFRICSSFRIYSKGKILPEMKWLKIGGRELIDDLSLYRDTYLCVSQRALDIILGTKPTQLEWHPYHEWVRQWEELARG